MQRAMGIWKWGPGLKSWTQGTRPCWGFSIALFLDEGFGSAVFRVHKRDVCWNSARYVDRQKYDWLLENRWQGMDYCLLEKEQAAGPNSPLFSGVRSEERRVGKECRS